ncbi:hypothetical protein ABPG72_021284 [Tetrahymena utriculariae]
MKDNYITEQALQLKNQQESSSSRADKLSSQNLDHSQTNFNNKTQRTKSIDQNQSIILLNDAQRLLELSQNQNQIYQQRQSQLQQQTANTQSNLITSKLSLLEKLEDEFPDNENFKKDDKSQIFYTAINQVRHIQSFTKKISQVFNKKQQDIFIKLREDLEVLMQQFDEKVVETLNKKEYELLKSFQITLDKMTKELQECQQKLNDFNLQVELDIKVIGLEKQLRFYRENSYSLNDENKTLKEEVAKLKHLYNELEQENLWSRQAHLRTQQKLNVIKEQNNYENQNSTKQSFVQKNNNRQNELDTSNLQQDSSAHNTLDNIDGVRSSKPSRQFKYRDSLIAARKVIFLQENVHQAANVIDQLLIEKINPRDQLIEQLKEQINNQKMLNKSLSMQIKTSITPNNTENQIKQLFIRSVSEVQNEIQKRNKMLNTFNPNLDQIEVQKFTKFDRIEVISKFFSSLKFLEIIKSMIFDQKCCNNPKCKFNVNEIPKNEEIQINENQDLQQNNTTQQPGNETNIKDEVSHYDYFDIIKNSQQDENNMNQTNLLRQSQESTLKKSIEDGQQFNVNRLYQIKHRTNISYYHPSINQNQSAIQYKKNRSNSHSSTAYSGNQLGLSDAQSTNLNTNRDQTYRSFGNTNQFYQAVNQSFEGNLNEKGNMSGNQSNYFTNQFNSYHKQLKQSISKQKQNQLEINNMHRKFHKYRKEVDNSKPQIETQISDLINNLTSQSKLNPTNNNIQNSEYITIKEKEDKVIFKHNKLY